MDYDGRPAPKELSGLLKRHGSRTKEVMAHSVAVRAEEGPPSRRGLPVDRSPLEGPLVPEVRNDLL